ncbi:hypothetical protein ACEI36_07545 [Pseudomonas kielensis]|uniref:hypothetical protein n=1 Tax=Pseudomonas kielensis TaxID=2762577 RepID=UPI0038A81EDE
MKVLLIALIAALIGVSIIAAYFYGLSKKDVKSKFVLQPFDSTLVAWWAAVFAILVVSLFFLNFDSDFIISNNIGQVGDFVGGLTNPILSFIALLVLLRTTMIQTSEARNTTEFLERQALFMDRQKFEGTFFQILNRLETYCEVHFRKVDPVTGVSEGERVSKLISANHLACSALSPISQLRRVKKDTRTLLYNDVCIGFNGRAMRALRLINNSDISDNLKRSFAGLLIDSMYPSERKIIVHFAFFYNRTARKMLRKWDFPRLKKHAFGCYLIFQYYKGEIGK